MQKRREQILAAAHTLLNGERGSGFTMIQLAEQAGVSLATPYNLFGSKADILATLFDTGIDRFHKQLDFGEGDPVEGVSQALSRLSKAIIRNSGFYYNLWWSLTELGIDPNRRLTLPISRKVLTPIAQVLILSDAPNAAIRRSVLAEQLARTLEINFIHWLSAAWPADRFEAELGFGVFSIASAMVDPSLAAPCSEKAVAALDKIVRSRIHNAL